MSYDKRKQQQQHPKSKKNRDADPRTVRALRHQRRERLEQARERELETFTQI